MTCCASYVSTASTSDHTVVPLSVARKRMSEIVIYKANECSTKVNLYTNNTSARNSLLDVLI